MFHPARQSDGCFVSTRNFLYQSQFCPFLFVSCEYCLNGALLWRWFVVLSRFALREAVPSKTASLALPCTSQARRATRPAAVPAPRRAPHRRHQCRRFSLPAVCGAMQGGMRWLSCAHFIGNAIPTLHSYPSQVRPAVLRRPPQRRPAAAVVCAPMPSPSHSIPIHTQVQTFHLYTCPHGLFVFGAFRIGHPVTWWPETVSIPTAYTH